MQKFRTGEQSAPIPPRSERFFKLENDWFFLTRGGDRYGPFRCREEAEKIVQKMLNPTPTSQKKGGAVICPFGNQRLKRWRDNQKF